MLRVVTFVVLALLVGNSSLAVDDPVANWPEGLLMQSAALDALDVARRVQAKLGLGVDPGISLVGGVLQRGATLGYSFQVLAGLRYAVLAAGDLTVPTLDLQLYEGDRLLAETHGQSDVPMLRLTRGQTGFVEVRVTMTDCAAAEGRCILMLLREDGAEVDRFSDAVAEHLLTIAPKPDDHRTFDYLRGDLGWCLLAGAVEPHHELGVSGLPLGAGQRIVLTTFTPQRKGHGTLEVSDAAGRMVATDADRNRVGWRAVTIQTQADQRYGLRVASGNPNQSMVTVTSLVMLPQD